MTVPRKKLLHIEKFSNRVYFFAMLIFLAAGPMFAADMYVPSLPHIANYFSVHDAQAKYTVSFFLFSDAVAVLFYGFLSDAFGRRPLIIIGLALFFVGSVICAFSPSITMLMVGRFIQGIGCGGVFGLVRSISRDCFTGKDLARVASNITMVTSVTLALAPLLGGYFQHYGNWRWSFYFMLLYSLVLLVVSWLFLSETNKHKTPAAIQPKQIVANMKTVFSHRIFLGNLIAASVAISGMITYSIISPFLLQNVLHVYVVSYAWLTVFIVGALITGKFVNIFVINKLTLRTSIIMGCSLALFGGLLMLMTGLFHIINVAVIVIPMMFFAFGVGLITTNTFAAAFSPFPKIAGIVGSIYGSIIIFVSFSTSSIAANVHSQTQMPLGALLTGLGLVAVIAYPLLTKQGCIERRFPLFLKTPNKGI